MDISSISKLVAAGLFLLPALVLGAGEEPAEAPNSPPLPVENRCGWFSNPTPANASLYDRDAEWIIGVQGGYQAEGDWPEFDSKNWVATNVHYGHGCACLKVTVDPDSHHILEIKSARPRPLAACRKDRALRKWGFR